jgi:shikimate kinase
MWPHSNKPLRLALIGMSGAGKSYWTLRIAAAGYPAISCDTEIENRLKHSLETGGYSGINGVAAWMGWPHLPTYADREAAYLSEEIAVLDEVLTGLKKNPDSDLVLDTTGSVIYVGNHLLHRLRKQMLVVYLAASRDEQQLLIQRYLEDPKPVLWRGAFHARAGEAPQDTVARCYPMLIAARRQSYEALAHCSIPVSALREPSSREETSGKLAGAGFLEMVRRQLERTGKPAKTEPGA